MNLVSGLSVDWTYYVERKKECGTFLMAWPDAFFPRKLSETPRMAATFCSAGLSWLNYMEKEQIDGNIKNPSCEPNPVFLLISHSHDSGHKKQDKYICKYCRF